MAFVVYIMECVDKTLYVGSTNDIERRLHQHNHLKSGAHYTKLRRPVTLVYMEPFDTLRAAKQKEYQLKKLTRKKKQDLIQEFNLTQDSKKSPLKQAPLETKRS